MGERALLGGSDLEHLGTADGALAFDRRTTVLHRDLDGVFYFTLCLALDTIRFCCQLGYLRAARLFRRALPIPRLAPSVLVRTA